jgi:alkylation response protein AidB-like acyl-CoA dehydrogenase
VIYLELTDEQEFLVDAAQGVLGRVDTLASARAALDGDEYVDLWPVAVEAGWPGLLIPEAAEGAGLGAYEAMLVLECCGARLADARLLGHLPATALLAAGGAEEELLTKLATGDRRAAFIDATAAHVGRNVLDAVGADVLVVATADQVGMIELPDEGMSAEHQNAYDATRSIATVGIAAASGFRGLEIAPERARDGRDLQRVLLAADSVGAANGCLQMARAYAIDRHAFGRAIGSYQAIKHKLVEMLRLIEGARSLLVGAGRAWATDDRAEFELLANAARVAAAAALDYAAPENIFIHGGIGATWEHDAQLYYRRAELSRRLCGGVELAADDVAEALFAKIPR